MAFPSPVIVRGNLDDVSDVSSDGAYEELDRRDAFQKISTKPGYQIDGKVPDVVYTLNHYNLNGRLLSCSRSKTPFANVTGHEFQQDGAGNDGEPPEKPILEIVTSVSIDGRYRRNRSYHPPRRSVAQQDRPITATFEDLDYRSDGYITDEEQGGNGPGFDTVDAPSMIIYSEHLINALRAVVAYYPGIGLNSKTININAPYRILHHHRDELARYRENQPSAHSPEYAATTSQHIDVLLKFLDDDLGAEVCREQECHKLETPMATFNLFWLLLKPGEVIYTKRYEIWTPYVISSVNIGYPSHNVDSYKISCWLLESNGIKIGRFMESCSVTPWLGEQAISSLPVIPAAYWVDNFVAQGGRDMRTKLVEEGRLYWDLLKRPTYMEYDGLLVSPGSSNRQPGGSTGFMRGRVICDASGFDKYFDLAPDISNRRYNARRRRCQGVPPKDHLPKALPRCGCDVCTEHRPKDNGDLYVGFEDLDPLVDQPPDNELFYIVLSKTIPGFILGTRRWGNLHLANLSPVRPNKDAFKFLVLEDDIKLTVKALSGQFASSAGGELTPWGNDFVRNKGEGRIFLLHGAPGVGKTCTAECIAELTNRPLISLTSGDLNIDSYRIEVNLSYFLELGQRYGALVLLDEADVYLERRRPGNISHNSLVSVFLRALEYYRGVLFLTTNRVSSFDTAFLSRIHVALHYKNLSDEDRERIWTHNFDRLHRDSHGKVRVATPAREYIWTDSEVKQLQWNGREIRNAMQTALALAESQAEDDGLETVTIQEKHIRAVVKMSKGFKDFIKNSTEAKTDNDGYRRDADGDIFEENGEEDEME